VSLLQVLLLQTLLLWLLPQQYDLVERR